MSPPAWIQVQSPNLKVKSKFKVSTRTFNLLCTFEVLRLYLSSAI